MSYSDSDNENQEYPNTCAPEYAPASCTTEDIQYQAYFNVLDQSILQNFPVHPVFINPDQSIPDPSIPRRGRPPRISYNYLMAQTINFNGFNHDKQDRAAALPTIHQAPANSYSLRHPSYSNLATQPHIANTSGAPYRIPTRRSQRFANSRTPAQSGIVINTPEQAPTAPSSKLSTQVAQPAVADSTILNPSKCQHPKHLKYNPDDLEPSKPRRGRPPRGPTAGLPVTIPVPRRLREVLYLAAGSRICNTCKRLTDLDEEYTIDPRYKGPE